MTERWCVVAWANDEHAYTVVASDMTQEDAEFYADDHGRLFEAMTEAREVRMR